MTDRLFELLILFGMLYLSFWTQDIVVYVVTAIIMMLATGEWWEDYPGPTFFFWGLAVYLIILALVKTVEAGGPARGLSQFKSLANRMRGRDEDG